ETKLIHPGDAFVPVLHFPFEHPATQPAHRPDGFDPVIARSHEYQGSSHERWLRGWQFAVRNQAPDSAKGEGIDEVASFHKWGETGVASSSLNTIDNP